VASNGLYRSFLKPNYFVFDELCWSDPSTSRALDAFDAGKILPGYLGKDYHELFSKCRREEEANYNAEIPDKDFEWFLRAV
jgi:glutamine synthetase